MSRQLILVRHGPVSDAFGQEGQKSHGRYLGRTEAPLSEAWRGQAGPLARFVRSRGTAACACSPQLRARQTAEAILASPACPVGADVRLDDDLREIDFGQWEGKTFEEIAATSPGAVRQWAEFREDFQFPGGESVGGFLARARRAAMRLAAEKSDVAMAVTHGGVIRAMICHFLGLPARNYILFDIRPGSCAVITLFDGKGILAGLNVPHEGAA